jgi:hypothetical protein
VSQDHFNHAFLSTEILDGLLQASAKLSARESLVIILIWSKGLSRDSKPSELHQIVTKHVKPDESLSLDVSIILSESFESFDLVVPASLSLAIARGMFMELIKC